MSPSSLTHPPIHPVTHPLPTPHSPLPTPRKSWDEFLEKVRYALWVQK
ncbi:MAG: hypothetical protein MUF49_25385 [Oculatellaceae cyanobacterium Prado106]|nr:hypothetical protein [Oculatellaceae cyanobacterium Prado106]